MSEQIQANVAGNVEPVSKTTSYNFAVSLVEAHGHVVLKWSTNFPAYLAKGSGVALYKGPVTSKPGQSAYWVDLSAASGEKETNQLWGSGWYGAIVAAGFSGHQEYVVRTPLTE